MAWVSKILKFAKDPFKVTLYHFLVLLLANQVDFSISFFYFPWCQEQIKWPQVDINADISGVSNLHIFEFSLLNIHWAQTEKHKKQKSLGPWACQVKTEVTRSPDNNRIINCIAIVTILIFLGTKSTWTGTEQKHLRKLRAQVNPNVTPSLWDLCIE